MQGIDMSAVKPWIGMLVGLLAGCASTPPGPPEEVAPEIVAHLDAGRNADAAELFERAADSQAGREALYPLLYDEARARFQEAEHQPAARVLGFMAARYPRALAVREALVYALFLQRAADAVPTPELVRALGDALAELRTSASAPPPWLALAEAQQAIDRGELVTARAAFAGFQELWDGRPAELTVYVQDVGRYLASHP
jgi:hypothetical protein